METTTPSATATDRKRLLTRLVFAFYLWVVFVPLSSWVKKFLQEYEGPWWLRLGLLFLLWLAIGLPLWLYRRRWRPDELKVLMGRQAVVFAFNGLIIGLVVVDQLQKAALIPAFAWTTGRLLAAVMGLLLAGIGWSKLRYR